MLFPTVAFAVFFVTAFTVNWLLRPHPRAWQWAMIALSLYFYGWADTRFVGLLVASAVLSWGLALAVERAMPAGEPTVRSRRLVRTAVAADLALLGAMKYHGFFIESVADALGAVGLRPTPPVLDILLPVGISFFTFHAISYVVDVGRGRQRAVGLGDVLLYMSFFPHLVAGPIVRMGELLPQFRQRPDPRRVPAAAAFSLIAAGLFKKVVVSSYLATELVDPVFGVPGAHGALELAVGTYAYAIQIYADFSGYTDIAIGCALLLGVRLPRNFDAPYRSLSVREFWRRWHITLSRWLRDYVYIPLGGSHDGRRATYRNLMVTMLLGGFWHGADWRFVVWGGLHGAFLVGERMAATWWATLRGEHAPSLALRPLSATLRWLLTFHLVCLAWIFFRADSVGTALEIVGRIAAGGGPTALVTLLGVAVIVLALAGQLVPERSTDPLRLRFARLGTLGQVLVLAAVLTTVGALGPDGVAPFIYFQF